MDGVSGTGGVVVVGPASWNTIVAVPRLPDGRPGTLFAEDTWQTLGGTSAGKALHLVDLGVPVALVTVVGPDHEGAEVRAALDRPGLAVIAEEADRTERHLNLMAGGDRLSVYLHVPTTPTGPLPAAATAALAVAGDVVLDLSPRSLAARDSLDGARVWTDLHDCDGLEPFHQPFATAAHHVFLSGDRLADPRATVTGLYDAGAVLVVCTLGADGALALDADGWHRQQAQPVEVVDTNGAGDAFLAGFLAATRTGSGTPEALSAGAAQATRALGSRGLAPWRPG